MRTTTIIGGKGSADLRNKGKQGKKHIEIVVHASKGCDPGNKTIHRAYVPKKGGQKWLGTQE